MPNEARQRAGAKGGASRQKRLRDARAVGTATLIAEELDRRALLHNSGGEPLGAQRLQPVIDVIAAMLRDVIRPHGPRMAATDKPRLTEEEAQLVIGAIPLRALPRTETEGEQKR